MDLAILNLIGLSCDIIGGLFLFYYGLPNGISKNGNEIMEFEEDPPNVELKNKWKTYTIRGNIGIILMVIGFLLQFSVGIIQINCDPNSKACNPQTDYNKKY